MDTSILWLRRDLRLDDNPALQAALRAATVVPVFIFAPEEESPWPPGEASRVWLRRSLQALASELEGRGSRLILRRGPSLAALLALIAETGADSVYWNRLYEPAAIQRDQNVKQALSQQGVRAVSHNAALLIEPWHIANASGEAYRVFTPFWRNARARWETLPAPEPAPSRLHALPALHSEKLADLLPWPRARWERGFWQHWQPGEAGARAQLNAFIEGGVEGYRQQRDRPDHAGTSRLSAHLHFGEISPRRILTRLREVRCQTALEADVEGYLRELGWREFAHHLLFHFPHTAETHLNPKFEHFPWAAPDKRALESWRRGETGVPIIDAGMRELWSTGWMHNRIRMIVASFLSKNLRQHWLHGARWFWDTLVDADLANNTLGWQWSAGSGADAAPYFRIFNPVSQAQKFDPECRYVRRWVPELGRMPDMALFSPWKYPELLRRLAPTYRSTPLVDLKLSREAALAAYQSMRAELH